MQAGGRRFDSVHLHHGPNGRAVRVARGSGAKRRGSARSRKSAAARFHGADDREKLALPVGIAGLGGGPAGV